jgi:small-conductance mechanosensitive channel
MFGWLEIGLLSAAAVLLVLRLLPWLHAYQKLFGGGCLLLLIPALFPRSGNPLGQFLFGTTGDGLRLPREVLGILWWVLGAWLFKSVFDIVLKRTFFPDNNEPHARRLFADLATGLIYVLAFVGIIGTVFREPVSTLLATSGVLAIVIGLALQNTLGGVFAGLAINVEQPFGAGDWITLPDKITGQVMQVNWRATRLRTWSHDMIVVPNSVASKAIVVNHSRPKGPHRCIIGLTVDASVLPSRVTSALVAAARECAEVARGTVPQAYACALSDSVIEYELAFAIESFAQAPAVKSAMLMRIVEAFAELDIPLGVAPTMVRILSPGRPVVASSKAASTA